MRTSYPTPSFANNYKFKLVDSTFIHAVHIAESKGSYTFTLGISLQSDPDVILWYILKDPLAVWQRITDPKQSPGFVYNNSVKGKQYTRQTVVEKVKPESWKIESSPNGAWKVAYESLLGEKKVTPKPLASYLKEEKEHVCCGKCNDHKAPIVVTPTQYNGYGPLLDVCSKASSCLGYLALGFNRDTKGLVIYYAIKNNSDVYALQTTDATLYQNWIKSDSLGRYFNRNIKRLGAVNVRRAAKA